MEAVSTIAVILTMIAIGILFIAGLKSPRPRWLFSLYIMVLLLANILWTFLAFTISWAWIPATIVGALFLASIYKSIRP